MFIKSSTTFHPTAIVILALFGQLVVLPLSWAACPPVQRDSADDRWGETMNAEWFAARPSDNFLAPPRDSVRPLIRAIRLFGEKDLDRAAELIAEFLAAGEDEDFLILRDEEKGLANSVADLANAMLRAFPDDVIDGLQVRYGVPAKQRLDRAVEAGDYAEIGQVMRRYAYTPAGKQAAVLLGYYHLDSGNALLAANYFQVALGRQSITTDDDRNLALLLGVSWYFGGNEEQAVAVFSRLAKSSDGDLRIGDRTVKYDSQNPLESIHELVGHRQAETKRPIDQWTMLGGNARRNARLLDGFPVLEPLWTVETVDEPAAVAQILQDRDIVQAKSTMGLVPAHIPLVVDGIVLAGNGKQIRGIDFLTGKRKWTVPTEITASGKSSGIDNETTARQAVLRSRDQGSHKQISEIAPWSDFLKGYVSSDAKHVYRLVETTVESPEDRDQVFRRRRNYRNTAKAHWLQALGIDTEGAVAWQAGVGQNLGDPQLNEINFLGTPLPVGDNLYVIGKRRQEVVLVVIDSSTGQAQWIQTLAKDDQSSGNPFRSRTLATTHSLTPSHADGILVCPTGKDTLVGVDVLCRRLLWGVQTSNTSASRSSASLASTVQSPHLIIDGRRVVGLEIGAAPRLMVLDLLTGESMMRGRKGITASNILYVAGVHNDTVVVVEKSSIRCVNVQTGRKVWSQSISKLGQPSGRGYLTETAFYLPTAENLILQFNLDDGKITGAVKSEESFGNLTVYQQTLISQTETTVSCYALDSKINAELSAAVEQSGDIQKISSRLKIHQAALYRGQGKHQDAVALLETVPEIDHDVQFKRELLRNVSSIFATDASDTERLIQRYGSWYSCNVDPQLFFEHVEFLVKSGRATAALEQIFDANDLFDTTTLTAETELFERPESSYDLISAEGTVASSSASKPQSLVAKIVNGDFSSKSISFNVQHWARSQLSLLASHTPDARAQVATAIEKYWTARNDMSASAQFQQLRRLPTNLVSRKRRFEIAEQLIDEKRIAEAEVVVAGLKSTAENDRQEPAELDLDRLNQRLNETYTVAAPPESAATPVKPFNTVSATFRTTNNGSARDIPFDIKLEGEYTQQRFAGKTIVVWSQSKELEILDRQGNSEHRFALLSGNAADDRSLVAGNGWLYAKHSLGVLRLRDQLIAIDLNQLDRGTQAVLWRRKLPSESRNRVEIAGEIDPVINMGLTSRRLTVSDPVLGYCCTIADGELECLDAFTGQTRWKRPAPRNHTRVIGDSRHVVTLDSRQRGYRVFDLQTGGCTKIGQIPELADVFWTGEESSFVTASAVRESRLDEIAGFEDFRPQPQADDKAKSSKRRSSTGSNRIFCRFDTQLGEFVWRKRFSMQARACRMTGNRLLVLADDGTVYIFDATTGVELSKFDSGLTAQQRATVKHVGVTHFGGRELLVFADNKSNSRLVRSNRMSPVRSTNSFFSGFLMLVEGAQPKPVWSRPIELVGFQILPMLPTDSPLLMLCRQIEPRSQPRGRGPQARKLPTSSLQLLAIDWRTGQVVFNQSRESKNTYAFQAPQMDLREGTIKFDIGSLSIQLNLQTIDDLPPQPPASITAYNAIPRPPVRSVKDTGAEKTTAISVDTNEDLAEKARRNEAALQQRRALEKQRLEQESER